MSTVHAVVDAEVWLPASAPAPLRAALAERLTLKLEPRRGDPDQRPRVYRLLRPGRRDGVDGFAAPRGALGLVVEEARMAGCELAWESRVRWDGRAPAPRRERDGLRPYQVEAAERLLARRQGLVVLPCGAGKSRLAVEAVRRAGQATVVLVHTVDLAVQWAPLLDGLGDVRVRMVGGGRGRPDLRPLAPEQGCVAVVQALHRAGHAADRLLGSAGCVVLDEGHHGPARLWWDLLRRCPARYRWGLTATPDREDGLGPLLPLLLGPVLLRRRPADLVAGGWLVAPRVLGVLTGWEAGLECWSARTGRLDWAAVGNAIASDPGRLALLVRLVAAGVRAGRTALVLVGRVTLARRVAELLRAEGVTAYPLTSEVSRRDRARRLRQLRERHLRCLVATSLADEGLDVPALDLLVLAGAGRSQNAAVQRVGRLMRPGGAHAVLALDLVDRPLLSQWRQRCAAYRERVGVEPEGPLSEGEALAVLAGRGAVLPFVGRSEAVRSSGLRGGGRAGI